MALARVLVSAVLTAVLLAAAAPARAALPGERVALAGPSPVTVAGGGVLRATHTVRRPARAASPRTVLLSHDARRDRADVALGRVRASGRRGRSTRALRVPAATRAATYRLLACARRRCAVARERVRVAPRALVVPALARPLPPAPPPAPAPPLPPPPTAQAAAPPEPAPPRAPGPAPGDALERIRECGLPAAPDDAPASAFTSLFTSARAGWTGGDGTFSVRLPDGRTAWLFGDTFVGGDAERRGARWLRNSVVVQDGDCLTTLVARDDGDDATEPAFLVSPPGTVLWPSDAVVRGDTVRAFFTRVRPGELAVDGTVLVTLALPGLEPVASREIPSREGLFWGAAVLERPEATYVFGVDAPRHRAHVARLPDGLDGPWGFWSGEGWSDDVADAAPVLDAAVATQLSVVPDGTGLLLATQPPFSTELRGWRAARPQGPWTADAEALATGPEVTGGSTYNALLHPRGGRFVASFNVNGDAAFADATLYRPRFARVVDSGP